MSEARAEELLKKLGIKYEREPAWIEKGRKPDFFCSEPAKFWCEVKTLERPEDSKRLHEALAELRKRTARLSGSGMGIAHVGEIMSNRDAKLAVNLLKRALKRFDDADPPDITVALIPKNAQREKFVRFSFAVRDQKTVEFHSCVSDTGWYAVPSGMFPDPDSQMVKLTFSSGETKELPAHDVIEASDDFRVAIAVHPDDETTFEIASAMPTGGARRLDNVGRIREAVSDANEQCKNANIYSAAPSLTIIFHDGLDVPDEAIIKSGLYGNLHYIASKTAPANGRLILDGDGAWNSTKNRTTSAIMYVRNNGEPLIIHNYWAERPLQAGLFSCREISVGGDGSFQEKDFSVKTG